MAGISQAEDWRGTVALARRRIGFAERLALEERLDALQVLAWGSVQLGELEEAASAADAAIGLLQPGQNTAFVLAADSWSAYVGALVGDWRRTETSVDDLRRRWLDAGSPSAAYALQGFLSGVDWARNRGADAAVERWHEVASQIVNSFPATHPVAAIAALLALDLDGVVEVIRSHERYPDRAHYVEHALALCTDRGHPVPIDVLDDLLARSRRVSLRVLESQALRARGLVSGDAENLRAALAGFEGMNAARYAARVRVELGTLTGAQDLLDEGIGQMRALGEGDVLAAERNR
jgi:hypothetical protein